MNDLGAICGLLMCALIFSGLGDRFSALGSWALWTLRAFMLAGVVVILAGFAGYKLVVPGSEVVLRPLCYFGLAMLAYGVWTNIGIGGAGAEERA